MAMRGGRVDPNAISGQHCPKSLVDMYKGMGAAGKTA